MWFVYLHTWTEYCLKKYCTYNKPIPKMSKHSRTCVKWDTNNTIRMWENKLLHAIVYCLNVYWEAIRALIALILFWCISVNKSALCGNKNPDRGQASLTISQYSSKALSTGFSKVVSPDFLHYNLCRLFDLIMCVFYFSYDYFDLFYIFFVFIFCNPQILLVLYNKTLMKMRRVEMWQSSYCSRRAWGLLRVRPVLPRRHDSTINNSERTNRIGWCIMITNQVLKSIYVNYTGLVGGSKVSIHLNLLNIENCAQRRFCWHKTGACNEWKPCQPQQ